MHQSLPFIKSIRPNRDVLYIALLFGAAFLIRSIGIEWGLPGQNYIYSTHVFDEPGVLYDSLSLGEGNYNHILQNYPFFYYLSFVVFGLYFFIGLATGQFNGLPDFKAQFIMDMSPFLLVGRYFIVVVTALTVVLVYIVGKRLFGRIVGLISSLFLLFSFGHIAYSKIFRLDPFLPFIFLLTLYLIMRLPQVVEGRLSPYVVTGILLGLTIGTKITGWAILVPYLLVPFVDESGNLRRRPRVDRRYVFGFYIAACTYVVLIAPVLLTFVQDMGEAIGRLSKDADYIGNAANLSPYRYSIIWHARRILPSEMGVTVYPFAVLGLILLVFDQRHRSTAAFLFAALFAYMAPIGYAIRTTWRDMLPMLPILSIIAAYGMIRVCAMFSRRVTRQSDRYQLALALTGILLILPVFNIYRQKQLILQPDTREIAKAWIEENIPAGSRIAIEYYSPGIIDETYREGLIEYVSETGLNRMGPILPGPTYELFIVEDVTNIHALDKHTEEVLSEFISTNNIEYVIISSGAYARYYNEAIELLHPQYAAEARDYYDLIAGNFNLIERFVPNWRDRPGPIIQIFEVANQLQEGRIQPATAGQFEPFPDLHRPATAVGYFQYSPR